MKKENVYVYDIETYRNFFSICFLNHHTKIKYYWVLFNDEQYTIESLNVFKEGYKIVFIKSLSAFLKNVDFLIGYNNHNFDDNLLKYLIKNKYNVNTISIWQYAQTLLSDKKEKPIIIKYKLPFVCFDLMRLHGFHKEGFRKSLKQLSINMDWHKIQELPIPVDSLITENQIVLLLEYNYNDVGITEKLFEVSKEDIYLRKNIQKIYGINVLNEFKSGIAKKLLKKFYSEESGLILAEFENLKTDRYNINIAECIPDKIHFQTPYFQDFLEKLRNKTIDVDEELSESVTLDGLTHSFKKGGIHSQNEPAVFQTCDEYTLYDFDFDSFYPLLMITLGISPKHLNKDIFLKILKRIVDDRIVSKKLYKQSLRDNNPDLINKIKNETLKIVVNALYGLMGSKFYFLFDMLCINKVCLAGELFVLMIIEDMSINDFQCIMSNTKRVGVVKFG
jgi:DNA polymerase elongation subunit (family B)